MEYHGVQAAALLWAALMSKAGNLRQCVVLSAFDVVLAVLLVPGARAQNESFAPGDSPAGVGSIQPVQMPRTRVQISPYQWLRARAP
jgi:hypothetical protein